VWYVVYESIVWRGGEDEFGQTCLLTFGKISSKRIREWGLDSFIEIVDLNVS